MVDEATTNDWFGLLEKAFRKKKEGWGKVISE